MHNNLGILFAKTPGRSSDAISHFEAALSLNPNFAEAHCNLGMLLSSVPERMPEAIAQLEAAQLTQPDPQLAQTIDLLRVKEKASR